MHINILRVFSRPTAVSRRMRLQLNSLTPDESAGYRILRLFLSGRISGGARVFSKGSRYKPDKRLLIPVEINNGHYMIRSVHMTFTSGNRNRWVKFFLNRAGYTDSISCFCTYFKVNGTVASKDIKYINGIEDGRIKWYALND